MGGAEVLTMLSVVVLSWIVLAFALTSIQSIGSDGPSSAMGWRKIEAERLGIECDAVPDDKQRVRTLKSRAKSMASDDIERAIEKISRKRSKEGDYLPELPHQSSYRSSLDAACNAHELSYLQACYQQEIKDQYAEHTRSEHVLTQLNAERQRQVSHVERTYDALVDLRDDDDEYSEDFRALEETEYSTEGNTEGTEYPEQVDEDDYFEELQRELRGRSTSTWGSDGTRSSLGAKMQEMNELVRSMSGGSGEAQGSRWASAERRHYDDPFWSRRRPHTIRRDQM